MKRSLLFNALAVLLAFSAACADDSVRSAQAALQSAGYYTGPLDGELNPETKAAVRRYQIRNQLEVSGNLTAETQAALNKEAPAAVPSPAPVAPSPVTSVENTPQLPPPGAVQGVPIPAPESRPAPDVYAGFFARTPYENAALEVQYGTVRQAQEILSRRGIYEGPITGRPGPATEEALIRFQAQRGIPKTGRLDIDTLAELHLLPVAKLRHPGSALPPSSVRGIPVD